MASSALRLKIVEGPETYIRARYECENRNTVTLKGEHSTKRKPTFPKIQIKGYSGYEDLEIQVSCVAAKSTSVINGRASYKAHPFQLQGEGCKNGICRRPVGKTNKMAVLSNIRILRVKVNGMHDSLMLRQSINADPYREGFNHANNPASIDKKQIRLCFELYTKNGDQPLCEPIVSDVIICEKKHNDSLTIVNLSPNKAPVTGNFDVILLCEKLSKPSEVTIRFSQTSPEGFIRWVVDVDSNNMFIHHQAAIAFKTPRYDERLMINYEPIEVQIRLGYPSENKWGPPCNFYFTCEADLLHQSQTFPQQMSWTSSSTVSSSTNENNVADFNMQPSMHSTHFENYSLDLHSNLNDYTMEYEPEPMTGPSSYEPDIPNFDYVAEILAAMTSSTYDTRVQNVPPQNQYIPASPTSQTGQIDPADLSFIDTLWYLINS